MDIKLKKKPKNPIIITGFPGFGLVGTIATEFLIDHLETEQIGKIWMDDIPAMVAVHEGKVVEPLGLFYSKQFNVVIVHGITAVQGIEWKVANAILKIARDLKAKEIVSLEGVGSPVPSEDIKAFFYTDDKKAKTKLERIGIGPLKEGIIMGVTGALMLRGEKMVNTSFFADTHSSLPDSKAAAKIIEVLDKYLGLKVDYKPLLDQAEKFEAKLQGLMSKSQTAASEQVKKNLSYVG